MIKILKFNCPDDDAEFELANRGWDLALALKEFDESLRMKLKHDREQYSEKEYRLIETIRAELWKFLKEHRVDHLIG